MEDKKEMETVCAVVVTYNRKNPLGECLDTLLSQTRPLDSIIIIDNASTDGTEKFLKKSYLNNPVFDYVLLPENTGGAGGFYEGVKRCYEKGYDWLWLMDDDIKLDLSALANLIDAYGKISTLAVFNSLIMCENREQLSFGLYDIGTGEAVYNYRRVCEIDKTYNYNGIIDSTAPGFFNGTLIPRGIIERVGYPQKELFIWGDEKEYVRRIHAKGFKTFIVLSSIAIHPRGTYAKYKIFGRQFKAPVGPPWKKYYQIRNEIYLTKKDKGIIFILKHIHKLCMRILLEAVLTSDFKLLRCKLYTLALIDGIFSRLGKRVDPGLFDKRFLSSIKAKNFDSTKSKAMKILYLGHISENFISGGARQISEVLKYLRKANVEVKFLSMHEVSGGLIKENFLLGNLWFYWHLIKMNKDNLIILEDYSLRFYFFILNWLVRATMKVKIVGLVQAFYFSCRKSLIKNAIDKVVSILFLKPMDMMFTSGQSAAAELIKMGISSSKIRNVYPVLRNKFIQNHNKAQPKSCKNSITHLLFVGRLHPTKGLEYLFEAIQILKNENLRLTIVGDTTHVPQYTRKINDRIKLLGITDRVNFLGQIKDLDELIGVYKIADIFVLPSLWDTSPIAVVEAMCFGLPIVATRVGGIPEWVEDGVNGILVPPKNPHALAHAILKVIQTPSLRKSMGQRAFEKSLQFRSRTWEDVGKEYYHILSELWCGG